MDPKELVDVMERCGDNVLEAAKRYGLGDDQFEALKSWAEHGRHLIQATITAEATEKTRAGGRDF